MDYQKHYDLLIARGIKRKNETVDYYTEMHHILPKCMGGSDDNSNLCRLTAKEHYVAHHLLYKIHKTPYLAHAWRMMTVCGSGQERKFTAQYYEKAKLAVVKYLKTKTGNRNHFYGRKHTNETKRILSEKAKSRGRSGWDARSSASKQKYLDAVSRPKTEEHKRKIGRKGFVMLQNINTKEVMRVHKSELCNYDKKVWMNPRIISCGYTEKKITNTKPKHVKLMIEGTVYSSIKDAIEALGMTRDKITTRLKSDHHPKWKRL